MMNYEWGKPLCGGDGRWEMGDGRWEISENFEF
jgi:hypothetical protein